MIDLLTWEQDMFRLKAAILYAASEKYFLFFVNKPLKIEIHSHFAILKKLFQIDRPNHPVAVHAGTAKSPRMPYEFS